MHWILKQPSGEEQHMWMTTTTVVDVQYSRCGRGQHQWWMSSTAEVMDDDNSGGCAVQQMWWMMQQLWWMFNTSQFLVGVFRRKTQTIVLTFFKDQRTDRFYREL